MLKHEAGQPETELLFSYGWAAQGPATSGYC